MDIYEKWTPILEALKENLELKDDGMYLYSKYEIE